MCADQIKCFQHNSEEFYGIVEGADQKNCFQTQSWEILWYCRDGPNVTFDSESNKENPTAKTSAVEEHILSEAIIDNNSNMDEREIDKVADIPIQDAFIFCPMTGTFVLNETLGQGIFASETEMDQTEATKNSIVNRFITINFEEKDANRSKMQAIIEYIKDVKENA